MLGDRLRFAPRARIATGVTLVTLLFTSTVADAQEGEPGSTTTTATTTEAPVEPVGEPVEEPAPTTTTDEVAPDTTEAPETEPAATETTTTTTTEVPVGTEPAPTTTEPAPETTEVTEADEPAVADAAEPAVAEVDAEPAADGSTERTTIDELEGCTVDRELTAKSRGRRVRCLEYRLGQLGYFAGSPDADWGPATRRALVAFQADSQLLRTGTADAYTLQELGIWAGDPVAVQCTVGVPVSRSSSGRRVACVEARLAALGLFDGVPDRVWRNRTTEALRKFQHHKGLIRSDVADAFTLHHMKIWNGPKPAFPCSISDTVGPRSQGADVACLEMRLATWGYDVIGPNQRYDAKTRAAIKAFEQSHDFIANGTAEPYTLQEMGIWGGGLVGFPCAVDSAVTPRSSGKNVACLEMRLATWGYDVKGPDRQFDRKTGRAIKAWERNRGIVANRIANPYTLYRMGIWSGSVPSFPCKVTKGIGANARGRRVACLESRLGDLGYDVNGPDRKIDATTIAAIKSYQSTHGLSVDGVAGPYTLASMGIWGGPPPDTILPANSGTGRRIVYSKARMRLWTVEADGTVSKTHRVSGNHGYNNPTPGTYRVYSKSSRTCAYDAPHICWGYMVRFAYGPQGGRIGFHEIPTNLNTGAKLQSESQLGLGLSAGCVRQSTSDAIYLWHWAPIGTKVVVLG